MSAEITHASIITPVALCLVLFRRYVNGRVT